MHNFQKLLLQKTVVHKYQYVGPRDYLKRWAKAKRTCSTTTLPFLDCVVDTAEVCILANKFGYDNPDELAKHICGCSVIREEAVATIDPELCEACELYDKINR
jgi:hypothetical protein